MAQASTDQSNRRRPRRRTRLSLSVSGFKAVRDEISLSLAPITIIAGTNSSGKSSFMQPFLLLKQTLEAPFDPGAVLLHGPNVKFTDQSQVLSRGRAKSDVASEFKVGMHQGDRSEQLTFRPGATGFEVFRDSRSNADASVELYLHPTAAQLETLRHDFGNAMKKSLESFPSSLLEDGTAPNFTTERNRCFIDPVITVKAKNLDVQLPLYFGGENGFLGQSETWANILQSIIHVPGLRGNPERSYSRSAVGDVYPGTFETYVASIIHSWINPANRSEGADAKLAALSADLQHLGLTWKVQTKRVDDASLELLVGRLPHAQQGGAHDLVSVADVGFGVSQTLPVLVALQAARSGQVVYIEQPEIHLHPRAQLAMAACLVQAAQRGVILVLETHSSLIIRGLQTQIALQLIPASDVSMNWFSRHPDTGASVVTPAQIDSAGRLGDWPLDFDEVSQEADWAFLDAVSIHG